MSAMKVENSLVANADDHSTMLAMGQPHLLSALTVTDSLLGNEGGQFPLAAMLVVNAFVGIAGCQFTCLQ